MSSAPKKPRGKADVPRMVRSACLTGYADLATSAGLDPMRMLPADLAPSCLTDPDTLIPAGAVSRLLEDSAAASGVQNFGLRLGEVRGLTVLGPLVLVLREAPTVRDALEALVRYGSVHSEALLLTVEESGDTLVIRSSLMLSGSEGTRQAEEMVLGTTCRILRELIGRNWKPRRVCFTHDAPRDRSIHLRVFGIPPEFGCDFNGLVCVRKDLETALPNARPDSARYAREYLDGLLSQRNQTTTDRVTRLARTLLAAGQCNIEQIADLLGVDRRTVHRRLAREGASFSDILDDVRADLVTQYLRTQSRSLTDISELLGFSSLSAFSRWFRDRFGHSASAWRANRAGMPSPSVAPGAARRGGAAEAAKPSTKA